MDQALIAATLQIINEHTDIQKLMSMLPRVLKDPTGEVEKKIILNAWRQKLAELAKVDYKVR